MQCPNCGKWWDTVESDMCPHCGWDCDDVRLLAESDYEREQDAILAQQELEDFEQCDEYFGEHPFDAPCHEYDHYDEW